MANARRPCCAVAIMCFPKHVIPVADDVVCRESDQPEEGLRGAAFLPRQIRTPEIKAGRRCQDRQPSATLGSPPPPKRPACGTPATTSAGAYGQDDCSGDHDSKWPRPSRGMPCHVGPHILRNPYTEAETESDATAVTGPFHGAVPRVAAGVIASNPPTLIWGPGPFAEVDSPKRGCGRRRTRGRA